MPDPADDIAALLARMTEVRATIEALAERHTDRLTKLTALHRTLAAELALLAAHEAVALARGESDAVTLLATNLRRSRLARGWTQEKLAERAGLDRSYVGQIERGETSPTVTSVERIARGLGVGVGELLRA